MKTWDYTMEYSTIEVGPSEHGEPPQHLVDDLLRYLRDIYAAAGIDDLDRLEFVKGTFSEDGSIAIEGGRVRTS